MRIEFNGACCPALPRLDSALMMNPEVALAAALFIDLPLGRVARENGEAVDKEFSIHDENQVT